MRAKTSQIATLLAVSNFSSADLHAFFRWVEQSGAISAVNAVRELRGRSLSPEIIDTRASETGESRYQSRGDFSSRDEITSKLENILVGSTGLTKNRAIQLMARELKAYDLPLSMRRPNKVSFRSWLEKLVDFAPPNEILSAASKVRNKLVHGNMDWPLRKEE